MTYATQATQATKKSLLDDVRRTRFVEQLLQNTEQGIWFLDECGRTTDLNDAMCRLLGRLREEVMGRAVFDFFSHGDLSTLQHQLDLGKKGRKQGCEIGIVRPDASRIACFSSTTPIYGTAGQAVGWVGMWTDLTPIKQAQTEAERAHQTTSQFTAQFMSQMSHELRTPLNSVLGFGQLLQSDPSLPLVPKQQLQVQEILRGAEHLLNLINGLLDIPRIEPGQFSVQLGAVPLRNLLREALSLMAPLAARSHIMLPSDSDAPAGLVVQADRTRLLQVLLNLLSNAIKYNRERGAVQVEWLVQDGEVTIGVRDNGGGLARSQCMRLFEPFQGQQAEGAHPAGAGVSLALSRRLMEAMGGEIGVDSEPGMGCLFWLRLPQVLAPAHGLTPPAPQDPDNVARTGPDAPIPTVLCIEDNPINLLVMQAMIARIPHLQTLSAEDSEIGLHMALKERPDLILTDIQMPGMDGFELLQRLRAEKATCAIPVVAISADAMPETAARGRAAGFAEYLTKPVQMDALQSVVQRLLGR